MRGTRKVREHAKRGERAVRKTGVSSPEFGALFQKERALRNHLRGDRRPNINFGDITPETWRNATELND